MTITAWDPGDTTGVAVWNDEYDLLEMKQIRMEETASFWKYIEERHGPIRICIVEDFVLFGARAAQQKGSRMKASQGIGSLRTLSQLSHADFYLQPASVKKTAMKQARITLPSKHEDTHEYDAYLHGYHWMVKNGKIKTQLQLEKEAERDARS